MDDNIAPPVCGEHGDNTGAKVHEAEEAAAATAPVSSPDPETSTSAGVEPRVIEESEADHSNAKTPIRAEQTMDDNEKQAQPQQP